MEDIVKQISKEKFNSYVALTIQPEAHFFCEEIYWVANKSETILGTVLFDKSDNDFSAVLLGCDERKQFRCFEHEVGFNTPQDALLWLRIKIEQQTHKGHFYYPQGDHIKEQNLDLFKDVVPEDKQHPYYKLLKYNKVWASAKKYISNIMCSYSDIDGNFVEQFQSEGFEQRLWELYLFMCFKEEKLKVDRNYQHPDFIVMSGENIIGIEAVTVSRKTKISAYQNLFNPSGSKSFPVLTDKILHNDMPIMWGSSLYTKLTHTVKKEPKNPTNNERIHYWELPYLRGKPFIIAIQDFHDDFSMTWSFNSLIECLYGYKSFSYYENNQLKNKLQKIDKFLKKTGISIPAGFFCSPDANNISAVIASPLGTLSKFNRMGKQAGFDSSNTTMMRFGLCHNKESNLPVSFKYNVGDDNTHKETWTEGLSIFHNPNATYPVPAHLFPNAAHHYLKNEQIVSSVPNFMPYNSYTLNVIGE